MTVTGEPVFRRYVSGPKTGQVPPSAEAAESARRRATAPAHRSATCLIKDPRSGLR